MTEVEGSLTPEEMELKPSDMSLASDAEQLTPDIGNAREDEDISQEGSQDEDSEIGEEVETPEGGTEEENPKADNKKSRWGETTPEQQEGMNEVQREVAAGLGMAFDILPHTGKLNEDRIIKVLNEIKTVQTMGPAVKIKIAEVIVRDKLHEGQREDFVLKLLNLEYVVFWVMSQGSQRADQKRADSVLDQIQNMNVS
ncbi:MAG: hypothetical protein COT25_03410 [Candidatus Kerfeldbacteria bacterium CG08_land_8_20_14_0_20_42_7]|uniref:Uncharacterized protein n=1 Tax=Candidatus Kerfeldbacteria bacterium CG08_land_8_20_14_0_20_42_7 TaxID=2014245 RepID=A0A2H0YSB6_9BACT|nr:MAG: hypothetical protein COT25_03410 [Candidatus Kerfeldbacteria bacterium CG08_land_8_20_14_0_20_42_7]